MAEPAYKVKQIDFKGRRVPVMLQDINGPCPLLGIANVLLLRNQLQLPAGVGEVSQDRLVQMVAGRLLDANSLDAPGRAESMSEEQKASLQHNMSDAIALLPKLTTGIDVNLRFHDIAGVEFTQETAVFDLLDIPLVHGWLVDPQDEATARAVGTKSYNELMVQLVNALGNAATPKQLTPTASLRRDPSGDAAVASQVAARAAGGVGSGGLPAIQEGSATAAAHSNTQQVQGHEQGQRIDAEALSAALRNSLHLTLPQHRGDPEGSGSGPASATSGGSALAAGVGSGLHDSSRAHSNVSLQTSDSMHSMVNRMLTDIVSDAFNSTVVSPTVSRNGLAQPQGSGMTGTAAASSTDVTQSAAHGEEEEDATSRLRTHSAGLAGSSGNLEGAAAASMQQAASGPLEPHVELALSLDEQADAERPVQVHLVVRQPSLTLPLSPFDSGISEAEAGVEAEGAAGGSGAGGAPGRRTCPATPHPSTASMALEAVELPLQPQQQQTGGVGAAGEAAATAGAGAGAASAAGSPGPGSAGPSTGRTAGGGDTSPGAASDSALRDALLVQQFLEGNPSQLTLHGLLALQEGLRPNQLAVFFRNNHFNTLYKGPDDQLFILVTDEGFQFESDVVWEQLTSVDGDTQLVGADFRPFQPHASQEQAHERQTAALGAAAAAAPSHDADLALAMQLQAEEEERVRVEQQRRQQLMARQQEEQRRLATQQQAQQQVQGQLLPSQRRPAGAGQQSPGSAGKKKKKSSTDSPCSIM